MAPLDARDRFDGPWKVALVTYFQEFLKLCFPKLHKLVDFSQEPEFLDNELEEIKPAGGRRSLGVDKLVRLRLKSGESVCALIHIEVQAQKQSDFARRMWVYHYRIYDKFMVHPVQLAVLADRHPKWKPGQYTLKQITGNLKLTSFATFKCLNLVDPEAIFTRTGNVFALIVAASNAAHQTRGNGPARTQRLLGLGRLMKKRSLKLEEIFTALRVLEWLLMLPADLQLPYRKEQAIILQEGTEMKIEDLKLILEIVAKREGKQEGRLEGQLEMARESILEVLEARFGEVPYLLAERIQHLQSVEALKQWHRHAAVVESMEAFASELSNSEKDQAFL